MAWRRDAAGTAARAAARTAGRRARWAATAVALALPLACGGGDGATSGQGAVLFAGPAGELVPHATGRSATFRVTATSGGASEVSGFTSTVTSNGADGVFATRYVSATGAVADSTSRDTGDEIVVERFVNDPGGPDEQRALLDPPVGVVRTPVVAGETIESSFARTLELDVRIGDASERRQILFVGSARRVAVDASTVTVPAGTYADAIHYAVAATGETRIAVLGESVVVTIAVAGDEWFAPGVGGVREELEVTVHAGDESSAIHFTTERAGGSEPSA